MLIISKATPERFSTLHYYFLNSWHNWLQQNSNPDDIIYDNNRTKLCVDYIKKQVDEGMVFVAYEDGKMIGYCIYSRQWNNLHIDDIFIKESYRRKGLAKKFIYKVVDEAKMLGCEYIHTDCDVDNQAIINLNLKLGFSHIGTLKNYWDKDVNFYKIKI